MSLSARRAWIEIPIGSNARIGYKQSLSARRAWIEMVVHHGMMNMRKVALRKESVDRNIYADGSKIRKLSRSPQGERG